MNLTLTIKPQYLVVDEEHCTQLCTPGQLQALIEQEWDYHGGNIESVRDLFPVIERIYVDFNELKSEPITDLELETLTETAGHVVKRETRIAEEYAASVAADYRIGVGA